MVWWTFFSHWSMLIFWEGRGCFWRVGSWSTLTSYYHISYYSLSPMATLSIDWRFRGFGTLFQTNRPAIPLFKTNWMSRKIHVHLSFFTLMAPLYWVWRKPSEKSFESVCVCVRLCVCVCVCVCVCLYVSVHQKHTPTSQVQVSNTFCLGLAFRNAWGSG